MSEKIPALPFRKPDGHKGDFGRVLVVAGSPGMTGAGALACTAALRSGAGLVTWALPKSLLLVSEILTVETVGIPLPETPLQTPSVDAREIILEAAIEATAVVMGPGLPATGETAELLRLLVPEMHAPLVLDAGGLTALGADWQNIRKRKAPTIVTPHPGEMSRLVNKSTVEIQADRGGFAKKYAKASGAVVVLKGAGTVVTDGERCYVNATGNSGMATAGAGDILAGMIAGLLAQRMSPFEAAQLAVYLHGLAGDLAAKVLGEHSLRASDILDALPQAFLAHRQQPQSD